MPESQDPSAHDAESYLDLLRWAYEGEVFGESFLAHLLRAGAHSDHLPEIAALHRLEQRTRDVLGELVDRHAVIADENTAHTGGEEFGQRVQTMTWTEFMRSTEEFATAALPRFQELERRGRLDGLQGDRDTLAEVVAHERKLLDFARRELCGDPGITVLHQHLGEVAKQCLC